MEWLGDAHEDMRTPESREKLVECCRKSGLMRAWDQSSQVEAMTREAELFPGLPRDRRGWDDEPPTTTVEEDNDADIEPGFLDDDGDPESESLVDLWCDWDSHVVAQ